MPVTRQKVSIVVRVQGQEGFVRLQRASLGSGKMMQKQCSQGELEYQKETGKLVCVHEKKERKPFNIDNLSPDKIERI